MLRGIYNSGVGMISGMRQMDVIANNIANADTTGFKKDTAVLGNFNTILNDKLSGDAVISTDKVYTDYMQGSLDNTNNKLDFAISGDGFFTVDNNGEKLTRDGSFALDKDNYLVTKDGYRVMGEKGPIKLKTSDFTVAQNGEIFDESNTLLGKLKLVKIDNVDSLKKYGNNLIEKTDSTKVSKFNGVVMQGNLETSNVSSVTEMVDMITVMRHYEANQKVLKINDELLGKAATEIGRV